MNPPKDNVIVEDRHIPVLLSEVMTYIEPKPGQMVMDGTLGLGGHAEAILNAISPNGTLYGVDRDPDALGVAAHRLRPTGGTYLLTHDRFDHALARSDLPRLDAILLDLGVSSLQLDSSTRGFAFSQDGPLDMRMDPTGALTARDIVNEASEPDLAAAFYRYGEEPKAWAVARAIVRARRSKPIESTRQLAAIVSRFAARNLSGANPATRVFQALRILVNEELASLERALPLAHDKLLPGGRLVVISFHSLEDRIVKQFIRSRVKGCHCSSRMPQCVCARLPSMRNLTRRPIVPGHLERFENPRARSAKLRAAERI